MLISPHAELPGSPDSPFLPRLSSPSGSAAYSSAIAFRKMKFSDLCHGEMLMLAQQSTAQQKAITSRSCMEPPPASRDFNQDKKPTPAVAVCNSGEKVKHSEDSRATPSISPLLTSVPRSSKPNIPACVISNLLAIFNAQCCSILI